MSTVPSLFDSVDVAAVTSAATRWAGPGALLVACLAQAVASGEDDRIVVGSRLLRPAVTVALSGRWTDETGGRALAVAFGAAVTLSGAQTRSRRVWCLLDAEACDDGGTWEAARAAAAASIGQLVACVLTPSSEAVSLVMLWRAAGWAVIEAEGSSVWEVLGGLDQALVAPEPVALVVLGGPTRSSEW